MKFEDIQEKLENEKQEQLKDGLVEIVRNAKCQVEKREKWIKNLKNQLAIIENFLDDLKTQINNEDIVDLIELENFMENQPKEVKTQLNNN